MGGMFVSELGTHRLLCSAQLDVAEGGGENEAVDESGDCQHAPGHGQGLQMLGGEVQAVRALPAAARGEWGMEGETRCV